MPFPLRLACLVLCALPLLTTAAPVEVETFDIGTDEGPILLPVTIGGKRYSFLLDTGATHVGYDRSLVPLMGKSAGKRTLNSPGGPVQIEFFTPPRASLGRLPLPAKPAMVDDMSRFSDALGTRIHGILGLDFLEAHCVRIDFERGRLTFLSPQTPRTGKAVALKRAGTVACVAFDVPGVGRNEEFLIDTACAGFASVCFRPAVYDRLEKLGRLTSQGEVSTQTAVGVGEERSGTLDRLAVGPVEARGLVALRGQEKNVLGLHFWARYATTFDFPAGKVYLEKTARSAQPDPGGDCSGMMLFGKDGRSLITDVADRSPAADAGLRKGDEVVSIAGRAAATTSLVALRRMLCHAEKTVKVVVKREGKLVGAAVRLAEPPGEKK